MEYKSLTPGLLEQLRAAVPGRVHTGEDMKPDYSHDEMPIYGQRMPDAVVECASTEEVAAVCKICYDNDVPIIPRGAGTGLCGGCVPLYGGVVVDTQKMNQILGYTWTTSSCAPRPACCSTTWPMTARNTACSIPPIPARSSPPSAAMWR